MPTQLSELTPQQRKDFRDKYDVFFFDKDGTVEHLDRKPIPGASEALALLESAGKKSILVTDTCLFTRNFLAKIIKPTFPQFTEENIMTSSSMLARHLKNIGFSKKIYVVGTRDGIAQELINSGFDVECDTELEPLSFGEVMGIKLQKGIGAVVVSVDLNFTFRKLYKALNYLKDPECVLFASADFKVVSKNPIIPGPGALVMPLVEITGKEMQWCSKSSAVAVEVIKGLGYDMNRCLFVGDGMENDIVCGNNCGMDTLLVTSGFSTKADLERAIEKNNTKFIPTYVADSVVELGEIYRT